MISVIIPCYNAERLLGETLESVFAQTRQADEVIVVDDCSTDRSLDVANRYPVRVMSTAENSGHAAARNIGINAVQGEVIAWVDSDDVWEPDHLESVVGLLEENEHAVAAYSAVRRFGAREGVWYVRAEDFPGDELFWRCFHSTIVPAMSSVTRTSAARKIGGFDASRRVAPDFGFWLRMLSEGTIVSTPRPTARYRWHDSQISSTPLKQLHSMFATRRELIDQFEGPDRESRYDRGQRMMREAWDQLLLQSWVSCNRSSIADCLELGQHVPGRPPSLQSGCTGGCDCPVGPPEFGVTSSTRGKAWLDSRHPDRHLGNHETKRRHLHLESIRSSREDTRTHGRAASVGRLDLGTARRQ